MPKAVAPGVPNLITFFGNRQGRSDAKPITNCVAGLNRLKGAAEQHGVTICVELLNSKVDHAGLPGRSHGVRSGGCGAVNSPRVKLLYDIYHMQIMEGDVIRTIQQHHHTSRTITPAACPADTSSTTRRSCNGRPSAEPSSTPGFTGYLAHEFVPTRDPMTSLREAVMLCDV